MEVLDIDLTGPRLHPSNPGLGLVRSLSTSSDTVSNKLPRCALPGTFDYEFGALDDLNNPLTKFYSDLMYLTFGAVNRGQMLFMGLCRYLPAWLIRYNLETGSDPILQKARENMDHVHHVARELIERKRQEVAVGQSEKDVLSLLGTSH